jgi:hypothetical protein
MAGRRAVTLGFSRHLPAHGGSQAEREREHAASLAGEERRNWPFFASQAGGGVLHAAGQAGGVDQATKQPWVASAGACTPLCGQPNTP